MTTTKVTVMTTAAFFISLRARSADSSGVRCMSRFYRTSLFRSAGLSFQAGILVLLLLRREERFLNFVPVARLADWDLARSDEIKIERGFSLRQKWRRENEGDPQGLRAPGESLRADGRRTA